MPEAQSVTADSLRLTRQWAEFYRSRGLNPLPSRMDAKRPIVRFAQWWEEPAPTDLFIRHETTNIQLMTGRYWRLLAIDLDGDEGRKWFHSRGKAVPTTWATHSGGDGYHLWFRLPEDYPTELPKAFLWKGEGKHCSVERLCDRSLLMAPPSIHPVTGKRYRFASKAQSPARMPFPAFCPDWVLALKPLQPERAPVQIPQRTNNYQTVKVGRFDPEMVLQAIPNKVAMAQGWGLRVASDRANHAGWCPCHAISREDRNPSASISIHTGRYWEPGERTISLFELGVRMGVYLDWRDAVTDLGWMFSVPEMN